MSEEAFQDFIEEAGRYLKARIARAQETFGIGEYERFDRDLLTGRFWWSDAGVPKVEADLILVGSISTESNTWLWAWANPSLEGAELEDINRVRMFGEERGFTKLIEPKWPADEVDGWEMTAVAARLLEADSAYRCPSANGFLYVLHSNLRFVPRG
ncbi:MAG TPA: hypothetical protein VG796_25405 [Verrucomicrobiales bacterium]|nr:hypothetical protein [Verrucomicrobiales bacterium]